MRQVGSISNEQNAQLFADYLVAEGIAAQAEREDGQWSIWVRDENHVQDAVEKLHTFVANPTDERYRGATRRAVEMRQREQKRRQDAQKNLIEMKGRWSRGVARRAPLVMVMIGVSVLVAIVTNFGDGSATGHFTFVGMVRTDDGFWISSRDYFQQIKAGEIWRAVTPIFIHFSLMHLLFNMYMLYYLGAQIENRFGTLWLGALVLLIAVTSNAGQAFLSQHVPNQIVGAGARFGGMSGVDYGLFGYVWMKTLYAPQSGLFVSQGTVLMLIVWFFLCLTPWLPVANGAHGVGLAMGIAVGYAPEWFRAHRRR